MIDFARYVRTIPDYPRPGIQFRDITPMLLDPDCFREAIAAMSEPFESEGLNRVAAIEARGFILGGAIAERLGLGFVPVRKKGKLPFETLGEDYVLEYGTDRVEVHRDAVEPGDRILIVDDLVATGGTALATIRLLRQLGGVPVALSVMIDLPDLGGADAIRHAGCQVDALCTFEGD